MISRTLFLIAAAGALFSADRSTVLIDGSSTVYPITVAVAERYVAENPQANVEVLVSGSTAGLRRLLAGEIPIADASRPINAKEKEQAAKSGIEFIELPVAFDGITLVLNPKNTFIDHLSVAELKRIWQADNAATTWNQVRPGWPKERIVCFSPGKDSGTFDFFTEAVTGKARSQRADCVMSEEDTDLVNGVVGNVGALSYFGYAYYRDNATMLRAVPVDSGTGPITPSPETIRDGSYRPLSRPIFIYVNKAALNRQEVADFVTFYLRAAQAVVPEVGYVAFDDTISSQVRSRFAARTTGSLFTSDAELPRFTTLLAQSTPGMAAPAAVAAPTKSGANETTKKTATAATIPAAISATTAASDATHAASAPAVSTAPTVTAAPVSTPAAVAAPAAVVTPAAIPPQPSAPAAVLTAPVRPVLADDTFAPAVTRASASSLAMARLALDPAASLEDLDQSARHLRGDLDRLLASLPDRRLIEAGVVSGVDAWRSAVRELVRLHAAEAEPSALASAARAAIDRAQRDQLALLETAHTPAELAAAKTRENALAAFTTAVEQWSGAILQAGAHP